MSFEYQQNDHDAFLLNLMHEAASSAGFDGVPASAALRSAHSIEEYAIHRTIAAVLLGVRERGLNIGEVELIGAYVDGIQSIPDRGFPDPLNRGKLYKPER